MTTPEKILLDIDTGIDDALAILLALNSPELELIACSAVAGNTTVSQATTNTLAVLEVAGRSDIPVATGATRPLTRRLTTATFFHGANGLGNVELPTPKTQAQALPAPKFLIETARRYSGELTLVATGPLTNLALALLLDPHWLEHLKRLIIMGGAVRTQGNVSPVAEANFYNDPEAAQAVFSAGTNITLVGLDVTGQTRLGWSDIASLDDRRESLSPQTKLALDLLRFYTKSYGESREAWLHDPLAVGIAAQPDLVQTERMQVDIETQSQLTRGQSVGYSNAVLDQIENQGDYDDVIGLQVTHPSNADVCLGVNAAAFVNLFRQRLGLG